MTQLPFFSLIRQWLGAREWWKCPVYVVVITFAEMAEQNRENYYLALPMNIVLFADGV